MKLLDLERVTNSHSAKKIWGEIRNAGELQQFSLGEAVTDLHVAVVGQADDIARISFFNLLAARRHKGNDRR